MTKTPPAMTVYGHTPRHDAALALCIAHYATCPFGCAKDGAPNCAWHVGRLDCGPAQAMVNQTR